MTPYGEAGRLVAAAIEGGEAELREVLRRGDLRGMVEASRVAPALALRAAEAGVGGPEVDAWRCALVEANARGQVLRHSLAEIAAVLGRGRIVWAPIKGLGLPPSVYPLWDERPTGDIDVLIAAPDLAAAQAGLRGMGWTDAQLGADEGDFLADEGYNWKALSQNGSLLELHYSLWGLAPDGLAGAMLARSTPEPAAGETARALALSDVYVMAAVHLWTHPLPRPLLYLWDLHRIAGAGGPGLSETVVAYTDEAGH
jgi:hypothetical protein